MIREILSTGIVFYVMTGLTLLGLVSRYVYYRLYRKFMKESENIGKSQNKLIRQIRQKFENAFRVNNGVNNIGALVDKYIYQFRFLGMRLHGWRRFSLHIAVISVLTGGIGAGLTIWQRMPEEWLYWYGGAAAAAIVLPLALAAFTNIRYSERVMYANIEDYLENTLAFRLKHECEAEAEVKAERRRHQVKQKMDAEEQSGWAEPEPELFAADQPEVAAEGEPPKKVKRRFRKKAKEDEIQQMKKSLDQIAADSEEKHPQERKLSKEEQQAIVEEILKEYLT